jgi:polyisoprenoid-binding protein YceI
MKKISFIICSIIAIGMVSAFSIFEVVNRSIDPNYTLKFSTGMASGTFTGLKGTVVFSAADPATSKIDVTLDAGTINTGSSLKDTHAKGEEWLNVAKYPLIKFTTTSITKEADKYILSGKLELRGVSKDIKVPASFEEKVGKGVFTGDFTINRNDYGVSGSGMKAKMVGDNIKVSFNIPTSKN